MPLSSPKPDQHWFLIFCTGQLLASALALGLLFADPPAAKGELAFLVTAAGCLNMLLDTRACFNGWEWAPTYHLLKALQAGLCVALAVSFPYEHLHFIMLAFVFWFAESRPRAF